MTRQALQAAPNVYNAAPYPLLAYADAHPARHAAIARLMELPVAPVETARYLEIGSAIGGHLLPLAMSYPRAHFTGIDLAEEQVAQANASARELGLENITFVQADILDYQPEPGAFDYVVAHGIYSWIAPEIRDALLALVARALASEGLGYVSYNTFPGWHSLMAVRRLLQLGAGDLEDPVERAGAGVDTVRFVQTLVPENSPLRPVLDWYDEMEGDRFSTVGVNHLVLVTHDELSEYNDPVYLLDFVAHALHHGLQHVADADLSASFPNRLSRQQIEAVNKRIRSAEEFEQYLDFVSNRTFRRSLLVHQGRAANRRLRAIPTNLRGTWLRSRASVDGDLGLDSDGKTGFVAPNEARITTEHRFSKAAFAELIERAPADIPYEALLQAAAQRAGGGPTDEDELLLCANLLSAFTYSSELVDLRTTASGISTLPGERPTVDPYARWMASRGETLLTTRVFDRDPVKPVVARILGLMDGLRTIDEIAALADQYLEARPGSSSSLEDAVVEVAEFAAGTGLLVPA